LMHLYLKDLLFVKSDDKSVSLLAGSNWTFVERSHRGRCRASEGHRRLGEPFFRCVFVSLAKPVL